MSKAIPKRLVQEVKMRYRLTKIKSIITEGPSDQRFLKLVFNEYFKNVAPESIDLIDSGDIEIPAEFLRNYGIDTVGAKQRVIAFCRDVESEAIFDGFRGVVDRDVDDFVALNYQSECVRYTDNCCTEAYLWSEKSLARILVNFRCEASIGPPSNIRRLYDSINEVCAAIFSIRVAAARDKNLVVNFHRSEVSLRFSMPEMLIDVNAYIGQCGLRKADSEKLVQVVEGIRGEFVDVDRLNLINGHDLLWILTVALRNLSEFSRRLVADEMVAAALVGYGIACEGMERKGLLMSLSKWACGQQ